jgi:glycosyltransferase involved in cell wall biosynthesis
MGTPFKNDKKIKVLGIETLLKRKKNPLTGEVVNLHSGVDYVRLVQPIKELGKIEGFKTEVITDYPLEADKLDWWEDKIKCYDVIFITYLDNPLFYSALKIICNKYGVKCVIDLDDNIWAVSKHHYLYEQYKMEYDPMGRPKFSDGLYKRTMILRDADYITVTNQFLKYRANEFTKKSFDKIEVLPNYIDLSIYDYKKLKPKITKEFVIGYAGGASHWADLHEPKLIQAITAVLRKYPDVIFRTTAFYPELKARWGQRYQFILQRTDFLSWVNEVWIDIVGDSDIVIAPLEHTSYSRAKSYIKFLEYSAGKRTGVYEMIDPYSELIKDGENGFLAHTLDEWVKKLSILIEDEEKRKNMAENAYKTTQKHQIKDGVRGYIDFFEKIVYN